MMMKKKQKPFQALNAPAEALLKSEPAPAEAIRTLKIRVADRDFDKLWWASKIINAVWYHCGAWREAEATRQRWRLHARVDSQAQWNRPKSDSLLDAKAMSGYDMSNLLKGLSRECKELGWHKLPQSTYLKVAIEYGIRAFQFNQTSLKNRGNFSQGWVPFRDGAVHYENGRLCFNAGASQKDSETGKVLRDPKTGKAIKDGLQIQLLDDKRDIATVDVENCAGCFAQDKRGKWFVCLQETRAMQPLAAAENSIGVDPGLDHVVTTDSGWKLSTDDLLRPDLQEQIAKLQRGKKGGRKQQVRPSGTVAYQGRMTVAHAQAKFDALKAGQPLPAKHRQPAKTDGKIKGKTTKNLYYVFHNGQAVGESMKTQLRNLYAKERGYVKHKHYEAAHAIVNEAIVTGAGKIFIGHYEPPVQGRKKAKLKAEGKLTAEGEDKPKRKAPGAKKARRVGWCKFKLVLAEVAQTMGIAVFEINEALTSKSCSGCGATTNQIPEGPAGLGVREWTCEHCGAHHDRDVNAAKNIKTVGEREMLQALAKAQQSRKGLKSALVVEAGVECGNGDAESLRGHARPSTARITGAALAATGDGLSETIHQSHLDH